MNWLQFISGMTGSLAWPVVVLILIAYLRKGILENLEEFELPGGYKAKFRKNLDIGQKHADELIAERPDVAKPRGIAHEEQLRSFSSFSDMAVLNMYKEVEQLLLQIRDHLGVQTLNMPSVMRRLMEKHLIDETTLQLFESLRKARNAAVHAGNEKITAAEALEFHDQAELLKDILRRALEELAFEEAGLKLE